MSSPGLYFSFTLGRGKIEPGTHCLRMREKMSVVSERGQKEAYYFSNVKEK